AYLVAIHLVLAGISWFVIRERPILLLAVEALFVVSIALGVMLVRSFFVPLELIRTGAELIGERDFTSQFRPVGQPEMDALLEIYNDMIRRLREERLTVQEQHYFLDRVLAASPAGIVTLDFDARIEQLNPSAGRLLGLGAEAAGRRLGELAPPLGAELAAVPVGASRVLALGPRRLKVARAAMFDRGVPRRFLLAEG
ncbi:MAG TPA: histidine kinase, partial [Acidobacteria bacterium]|nr:histidine kinase [Acidobacteriota bacterium]